MCYSGRCSMEQTDGECGISLRERSQLKEALGISYPCPNSPEYEDNPWYHLAVAFIHGLRVMEYRIKRNKKVLAKLYAKAS